MFNLHKKLPPKSPYGWAVRLYPVAKYTYNKWNNLSEEEKKKYMDKGKKVGSKAQKTATETADKLSSKIKQIKK